MYRIALVACLALTGCNGLLSESAPVGGPSSGNTATTAAVPSFGAAPAAVPAVTAAAPAAAAPVGVPNSPGRYSSAIVRP